MRRIIAKAREYLGRDFEKEREMAYLNESVNVADLERRMREVDSGRFRGRF